MTNRNIANYFNNLAAIMELHGENQFKTRSYRNAYLTIRKLPTELNSMADEDIASLKGVGKAIFDKIKELINTGELQTFNKYADQTPPGVIEMLNIKGFGPKKIAALWKTLEIESPGEALYACNENRLIELKGFGAKTQEDLKKKLTYYLSSRHKFHFAVLAGEEPAIKEELQKQLNPKRCEVTGAYLRKLPILEELEYVLEGEQQDLSNLSEPFTIEEDLLLYENRVPIKVHWADLASFDKVLSQTTGSEAFRNSKIKAGVDLPPELQELPFEEIRMPQGDLIQESDIKGVVHSHTTWSDGVNSTQEMAEACIALGYSYLVISDHSKAAFYANGLTEDRLYQQFEEIDALNDKLENFKIFKSVECDILNDGTLDYDDSFLKNFDLIIASVHSNLRMDKAKATNRIIKAVENPATGILGHPTGRLLLSREGYPLDFEKVMDACAANGVHIELNANPLRLDLDWRLIPRALEKGIKISINPDAHSTRGIEDIKWGVFAARKGGVTASDCINTMDASSFEKLFN